MKMTKLRMRFRKCPRCGYTEGCDISSAKVYSGISGDHIVQFTSTCKGCGFMMSRPSMNELKDAWNTSKKTRVSHVKDCINGIPSVTYPGGCAYIGRDAVEMWRDEDGGLEKLRKHLQRSVGKKIEFKEPSDGNGMIVYSTEIKLPEKFDSFEDYVQTLQ